MWETPTTFFHNSHVTHESNSCHDIFPRQAPLEPIHLVTWLIHICDMTRSHAWRESLTRWHLVTWLIHFMTWHDSVISWLDSVISWLHFMTHWHLVTWLIHICDMTHWHMCPLEPINAAHDWIMAHHLLHVNESCHTYEWVMSHTWRSHVSHVSDSSLSEASTSTLHKRDTPVTHSPPCQTCEWVMLQMWTTLATPSRGKHIYNTYMWHTNDPWPTLSNLWMGHVTHVKDFHHTFPGQAHLHHINVTHKWIAAHHVKLVNGSCHKCKGLPPHLPYRVAKRHRMPYL